MNNILEKVVLTDVLSAPTKMRPETNESTSEVVPDVDSIDTRIKTDDFGPYLDEEDLDQDPMIDEEDEDDDFDAEESAESAIDILDVIQQGIFMPVSYIKLVKRFGGKEKINELKSSFIKKTNGEKLSEEEEQQALRYEVFDEKLREVRKEIPFNEIDVAALKPATIKYCAKKGIDVNENLAIGAGLVKVLSSRLITLMMI